MGLSWSLFSVTLPPYLLLVRETELCVCVGGGVGRETEIYFKELAHMIKETDKTQDL